MREDALITEVRYAAQLPDEAADYTDARIRTELNIVLQERFAPELVAARVGMLLKPFSQTLTAGTRTYPLPSRAMAAGFECLDITDGTSYWPLTQIAAHDAWKYETTTRGRPAFFTVVGSSIRLYPTPDIAYTLRSQYYLRPSRLVEKQTTPLIGVVEAVDLFTARTLLVTTVASVTDRDTGVALVSGKRIDVIRGPEQAALATEGYDASYEVVAAGLSQSISGTTITLTSSLQDYSEVRAGDYVRAHDQSEWPTMPHEYHAILAKAAAARICRDRGMYNAAQALEEVVSSGLSSMKDAIQPRVKSQAQVLVPHAHMLRMRGGYY